MKHLVYLAGPITGLTYNSATNWRETVKNLLHPAIDTLSPLRGKSHLKTLTAGGPIQDSYEADVMASSKGINTRDYNDVKRCDALLVNLLGAEKVSIGTVMEIAWARALNKPVVLVIEAGNIHEHSMLLYACGFIVPSVSQGVDIINRLLLTDKQQG